MLRRSVPLLELVRESEDLREAFVLGDSLQDEVDDGGIGLIGGAIHEVEDLEDHIQVPILVGDLHDELQ